MREANCSYKKSIHKLMKPRTRCTFVIVSIRAEIVRLAKIKVLALFRFGKIERVRNSYR